MLIADKEKFAATLSEMADKLATLPLEETILVGI